MNKGWLIYTIMKQLYATVLRDLLVKAVDDPESDHDDLILSIIDRVFDYGA